MEKGTRVVVVGGRKAKGVTGTVFWTGPDQYGDGLRLGVRGDDGETHWLNAEHVDKLDASDDPGPAEPPDVDKGAWVSFQAGGETLEGEVFWIGENKFGPGLRLGVRDADDETHWLDAVQVKVINAPAGPAGAAPPPEPGDAPPPPGPEDEPPLPDLEEPPPGYE
jgi:hypothetical protein